MIESFAADPFTPRADPQRDYKVVERWAVGGLLLGILSPLTLIAPILWLVPLLGLVANAVALRRIKLDANLVGGKAALLGLALSIVFVIAPVSQYLTSFAMLSRQAQPIADQWFECLRQDSPEKALMLKMAPDYRPPMNEDLWLFYRHDGQANRDLRQFVEHPLVRTLLALGDRAQVRFYKTTAVGTTGSLAQVQRCYTVTYPDQGGKKTFFVLMMLERKPTENASLNPWCVKGVSGGFDPTASEL
jgi:hypothetical protein